MVRDQQASTEGAARQDEIAAVVRLLPAWQLALLRLNDRIAQELGIAGSDLQCLFLLDRQGRSTPGAIARATGLTSGAATRVVDRLLDAGLVAREPDPDDRRRVHVTIRPAASVRLHALYDPLDHDLRALLDELDDQVLRRLHAFVDAAVEVSSRHAAGERETPQP